MPFAYHGYQLGPALPLHNAIRDEEVKPTPLDHLERYRGIGEGDDVVAGLSEDAGSQGAKDGFIIEYKNAGRQGGTFSRVGKNIPTLNSIPWDPD
jgi:hypothetical protein